MKNNVNKDKEVEARWINLDAPVILNKLEEIGAKQTGDFFFREWIFDKPEWRSKFRRVRVRTDGKNTWLTYKANATWAIDSTEEVELNVSSADGAAKFLKAIDLPLSRYQEKKRKTFTLGNITFDVDFWPKIPMVLEIEASTEKQVKEGAKLLDLDWKKAIFVDQLVVHREYFGIDLHKITDYRFG